MSKTSVDVKSERNPSARDPEKRVQPFASVLLVALVVIPLFCLILRSFAAAGDDLKWMVVWLDLVFLGIILPGIALGIGYKVAKRIEFVTWHVAITIELFAMATSASILPGWDHVPAGHRWWHTAWATVLNVVLVPAWFALLYLFGALVISLSWLLYRIDAFRSSTGTDESGDQSGLAALVKWPKGAKIRTDSIVVDDFAITAEVDHAGIPLAQIQQSVKSLEEHPSIIRGRSSVIGGERGGTSTMRLLREDPHSVWRVWPGLSHPGGYFHEPIRTSYYSTGETQWYSFVRTPDGYRSSLAPDFASPNGTFKGSQGMTSAGKSGDAAIEQAEIFSRRDVQVLYIDTAKLLQNAGWCLDFVSLAAANREASGYLFEGLRRVGEYRTRVLGEAGIRDFSSEAVAKTGLSWVYIFADEFDVAKQGAAMQWLATKGRSVGFRFAFTLPRATSDNLDTNIRAAVGMWAQFGISQDYDKGFVLSDATIEAGANPEMFGINVPGAHYLDNAPGIDPRMYAIDCRTYRTREDYGDLRRAVEAARATFTPMTWTEGELKALGPVAQLCKPSVVRAGHIGQDEEQPPPDDQLADPTPTVDNIQMEGTPMQLLKKIAGDDDMQLSPTVRAMLDDAGEVDTSEYAFDPREPIAQVAAGTEDDGSDLPSVKPKPPSKDVAVADFENALIQLHRDGVLEFGREEVQERMRYEWAGPNISKRFTALTEDETLNPPGLKLERLGRGRFTQTRVDSGA